MTERFTQAELKPRLVTRSQYAFSYMARIEETGASLLTGLVYPLAMFPKPSIVWLRFHIGFIRCSRLFLPRQFCLVCNVLFGVVHIFVKKHRFL